MRQGGLFHLLFRGRDTHHQLPFELAVDLQHQLHNVTLECVFANLGPRRVKQRTRRGLQAKGLPQVLGHVRAHRRQNPKQDPKTLHPHRLTQRLVKVQFRLLQGVEHFHEGRDHRVVLHARIVKIGLFEHQVNLTPEGFDVGTGARGFECSAQPFRRKGHGQGRWREEPLVLESALPHTL